MRIISCPACPAQYDQDAALGPDGKLCAARIPCGSPGAEGCAGRRRWAETEVPDDGMVDPIAVEYAAKGIRVVRLTHRESVVALSLMTLRNPDITAAEAARRLGITVRQLVPIMESAGLQMTPYEPVRRARHFVAAGAA